VEIMNKAASTSLPLNRKLRLAYFVTHPIQYQAPLLRRIAQEPDIDLKVFFGSALSVRGHLDREFGVQVKWDIPLLEGYAYEFLPVILDVREGQTLSFLRPLNRGIGAALRKGKFDAVWVHGYSYSMTLQAIRAAHAMDLPILLRSDSTLHDRPRSKWKLALKRRFFSMLRPAISAVLSVGSENTAYWKHSLGEDLPVFRAPYAVDNDYFERACAEASQTRAQFRESLGLAADRPVILFAAKLMPRKRCGDLIEAFLQLTRSSKLNRAPYLFIVGAGEQQAELELKATAARPGDVRFLGFQNQSELPRFYDLCDVFVLASVDEPWGLAINEAMAAGRAIIASDQVGCQRDLVQSGINGFVVSAGDVSGLAGSLEAILTDPLLARKMGAESRRIISDYTFQSNVEGLREALAALVPGFPALRAK
jgi:glycosyltransferase involved in cell wall biosynthesis